MMSGDKIVAMITNEKINLMYLRMALEGSKISMKDSATIMMKTFLTHSLTISIGSPLRFQ